MEQKDRMLKQDKKYKQLLREVVTLRKENKLLRKELTMAEDMIHFYEDEQYEQYIEEWGED